jgi:hypothetical protein
MKKLSLDLETLAVESFATATEQATLRGTVRGHLQVNQTWDWCGTRPPEMPTMRIEDCHGPTVINCPSDYGCGTESQYWACGPQPTQFDPSCAGSCAGPTCDAQVCIPF